MNRANAATLCFLAAFMATACDCGRKSGLNTVTGDGVGPASIDFGNEQVGQTKTLGSQLILTNKGGGTLGINGYQITGPNAADFSLTAHLPTSVLAGGDIQTALLFKPSAAGTRTATLQITTDSVESPSINISLTGLGVQILICMQPSTLDFGKVQIKGTPVIEKTVLTNCGGSPATMQFNSTPIEGPNAADFTVSGQTNTTLQPGTTMTLTVAYAPGVVGASTADIPFVACNGCSAQRVSLTGQGVDGVLAFTPNPINYGPVQDGMTVNTIVTGTNNGSNAITVTGLTTMNGTPVFVISSAPAIPISVPAMASFTLTVSFSPATPGADSDVLQATYTVADPMVPPRTATDDLSGNATLRPCTLQITPSAVSFGNVKAGVVVTKTLSLKNTGQTNCDASGFKLSASTDPAFALVSPPTTLTIAPATSATLTATFTAPSTTTPPVRRGQITFQSGDPLNPNASVTLVATLGTSVYSAGWPKWHQNNANTGQSEADTSWLKGTVEWKYFIGPPVGVTQTATTYINSPVVDVTGNIYQVGMNGVLYAIDSTGKLVWSVPVSDPSGDPHPSTPAILADGSMYVASGSDSAAITNGLIQNLFYISNTGTILSSQNYGEDGFDACPGLGNDGTLFLADDDGSLGAQGDPFSALAFSASGSTVTEVGGLALPLTNESERFGIVIADDNTSYWGNNGQYFAITPPGGSGGFQMVAAWPQGSATTPAGVTIIPPSVTTSGNVISDVALDSLVYNHLYAYSAWENFGNTNSVQGVIAALDPGTGAILWTVQLPPGALPTGWTPLASDSGNAAPAVADDGTVYVGNGDGLRAIEGGSGGVNWLFTCSNVSSSPAIGGDGTVFFGTSDGNLYAVHPDGTLRFKIQTGGPVSSSPAIAIDGTVYFISDDGNLYAIQ
jgi:outer membrane protein assembly factor BamB